MYLLIENAWDPSVPIRQRQTSAQRTPTIIMLRPERCPYELSSKKDIVNSSLIIPFSKHSTDFHKDVLHAFQNWPIANKV